MAIAGNVYLFRANDVPTKNRQNEITSVSGATTPIYDNNGNLTTDENNYRFVYNAWNKVVQVKNSSNVVIVTYGRDALHRHVTDTVGSTVTDRFFSNDWQLLETKTGSNTLTRNVWSPVYVDGLVLRDRDTDANGTLDKRLYSLQDANWNTTALVNTTGTVQERYTYTPFGQVTFRDGSGSTLSASAKDWVFLHQGGERIAAGDYEFRNRVYSPNLGRWLSNDPLGFNAGDQNWYRAVGNNPGNGLDPSGLDEWWFRSDPLYFVPVGDQNLFGDFWKTYVNPKRSQRYLESKIRTNSDGPLTIAHGYGQSFFDDVQQVGPAMLDKVAEDAAEKVAGAIAVGAAGAAAKKLYDARKAVKVAKVTKHVPSGPMAGKRIGHTFDKHGSHNTYELTRQAQGSGHPQGQWLDDIAAEKFIAEHLDELANGAKTINLPKGIGRVIMPNGSFVPATKARLVPSKTGVITAYPTN